MSDYSLWRRSLDLLFIPIMVFLRGFSLDSLQKTHIWNHKYYKKTLSNDLFLTVLGSDTSNIKQKNYSRLLAWLFHAPIFGGWKHYVVIKPVENSKKWFIGWKDEQKTQISLLPLTGPVKMLVGPKGQQINFFGIDSNQNQIMLEKVDCGIQGDLKYKHLPLL